MYWLIPDRGQQKEVLEDHLSEGGFCWSQWELDLVAHDYVLPEVAFDEQRMWRHVQALSMAGPDHAARVLAPALQGDEEKSLIAALALLATGQAECTQQVLDAFACSEGAQLLVLERALQLSLLTDLRDALIALMDGENAELIASALAVLTFWRAGPLSLVKPLCSSDDVRVRAGALRCMHQFLGSVDPQMSVRSAKDADATVRAAALELGLLLGLETAWMACLDRLESPEDDGNIARLVVALAGRHGNCRRLVSLLQTEELRRDVLWVLGFTGDIESAETCLEWVDDSKLGPVAAESFSAITGMALEEPYVETGSASFDEEDEAGLDDEAVLGADFGLPVPIAREMADWWQEAKKRFSTGNRYLNGLEFDPRSLPRALHTTCMRRREGLALELAIRTRGKYLIQTRAPSTIQLEQMRVAQNNESRMATHPLAQILTK